MIYLTFLHILSISAFLPSSSYPPPCSFPHYDHYLYKNQSNTQALHLKFTRENRHMWTQ